ncbi:hypothetical protein DFQ27_004387 [Actinomortierella ambigua]|uniref:Uncharacterized protein n=1 Tax=Actinomortierella ambigua TaxID=1343610 RepID=A0A9P6Q683_9FUNG|nr:hypothetical protein DFQ27_004387 [Actinomortierella ambigua]
MVCAKCEKKLAKLATKDTYKDGTSKTVGSAAGSSKKAASGAGTSTSGGRVIGENKLLSKKRVYVV